MIENELKEGNGSAFPDSVIRQFATICLIISFVCLGWVIYARGLDVEGLLVVSNLFKLLLGLIGCIGFLYPPFLRPVFIVLMALVSPLGHAVGIIIIGIAFYGVLTPIALVLRVFNRDSLRLKCPNKETFWLEVSQGKKNTDYLRQYQKQFS